MRLVAPSSLTRPRSGEFRWRDPGDSFVSAISSHFFKRSSIWPKSFGEWSLLGGRWWRSMLFQRVGKMLSIVRYCLGLGRIVSSWKYFLFFFRNINPKIWNIFFLFQYVSGHAVIDVKFCLIYWKISLNWFTFIWFYCRAPKRSFLLLFTAFIKWTRDIFINRSFLLIFK